MKIIHRLLVSGLVFGAVVAGLFGSGLTQMCRNPKTPAG